MPAFPRASALFRRAAQVRKLAIGRALLAQADRLQLGVVGRNLFDGVAVGVAAGLVGAALFAAFEYFQRGVLEELAGYIPLRADGETFAASEGSHPFRPWLLFLLPALGGLACGLVCRLAPETRGGGGDAMIEAFHLHGGLIRRRVIWVKALASMFTLGTGGAGGREGPTMQIGGALGGLVGRWLRASDRERRILMVSGVAAGMSAVFRCPLGSALLAVEVLYKDGFESEALIPAVLSSVVSYSVVIPIFGESTLFARVPRFPFVPEHLPLFGLLALLTAALAVLFVRVYRGVHRLFDRLPIPAWTRPAAGGLALGALCTPAVVVVGNYLHAPGEGLGLFGGGYGAVQMAISGSPWLPAGWITVGLLVALSLAKLFAASLTIGSGGSAGDFAPSLAIGGLFGGAFGRAAELLTHDPRLQSGAFALVGMGTFYGGIAHVPLSALVLVCELAGNYDLLVPLMLAQGIAFVALRNRSLYPSQMPTMRDSPAHRDALVLDVLRAIHVRDLMKGQAPPVCFFKNTPSEELVRHASRANEQDVFPVLDADNRLIGLVTANTIRLLSVEMSHARWTLAADLLHPPISVTADDDLRGATEAMIANELREIPIVSSDHQVIGMLDEADIAEVYLRAAVRAELAERSNREPRA
ncbi:MAG TPA: chloride channel protein [Polyangiaceae bacterium]|nr:chloride channel protein [Polyangiaceae bacterium]